MHSRYLLHSLTLKRTKVNTFGSASRFQIAIGNNFPAVPPDLGIGLFVPVNGILFV